MVSIAQGIYYLSKFLHYLTQHHSTTLTFNGICNEWKQYGMRLIHIIPFLSINETSTHKLYDEYNRRMLHSYYRICIQQWSTVTLHDLQHHDIHPIQWIHSIYVLLIIYQTQYKYIDSHNHENTRYHIPLIYTEWNNLVGILQYFVHNNTPSAQYNDIVQCIRYMVQHGIFSYTLTYIDTDIERKTLLHDVRDMSDKTLGLIHTHNIHDTNQLLRLDDLSDLIDINQLKKYKSSYKQRLMSLTTPTNSNSNHQSIEYDNKSDNELIHSINTQLHEYQSYLTNQWVPTASNAIRYFNSQREQNQAKQTHKPVQQSNHNLIDLTSMELSNSSQLQYSDTNVLYDTYNNSTDTKQSTIKPTSKARNALLYRHSSDIDALRFLASINKKYNDAIANGQNIDQQIELHVMNTNSNNNNYNLYTDNATDTDNDVGGDNSNQSDTDELHDNNYTPHQSNTHGIQKLLHILNTNNNNTLLSDSPNIDLTQTDIPSQQLSPLIIPDQSHTNSNNKRKSSNSSTTPTNKKSNAE